MTTFEVGESVRYTSEFRNLPGACADGKIHKITKVEAVSSSPDPKFREGLEKAVGHPQWVTLDNNGTVSGMHIQPV